MENEVIKVLVVDDQKMIVDGIVTILSTNNQINVVGCAFDGEEAYNKTKTLLPDVVLMDIRMPKQNGVITTAQIKHDFPDVKVLILTTFDDYEYILDALNLGASGYLLKSTNSTTLIDSIINVNNGDTILPSIIAKKITNAAKNVKNNREIKLKKQFNLSDREVEFAIMVYEGFNNKQISSALDITEGTARNYISTVYNKLGADNRTDAIRIIKQTLND